ncbi:PH domain-containing protein [Brachybacterium sp. NPDC056505]|uniref:PH domain-containing protein n=1 Tax=Brachybacterium sp. NPDC056505 TaxID=3345843 RepID=UPI003670CA2C
MSISAPDGPEGTVVLRPRVTRVVAYVIGSVVMLAAIGLSLLTHFGFADTVGFLAFGLAVLWFCHREGSVRATAHADRLVVRNLMATRELEWAEIIGVVFPPGDPWAKLDLADGDTLSVMAVQRTDGEKGMTAARRLAGMIAERSGAEGSGGSAKG